MSVVHPMLDRLEGPRSLSRLDRAEVCGVLLIEDSGPMRSALADALRGEGYDIVCAADDVEALECLNTWHPDLVLLDLSVHANQGIALCRRIREASDAPIILVAPAGAEAQVLVGLEIGATDYVVRPLDSEAVTIRISTVTNRLTLPSFPPREQPLVAGPLSICLARRTIEVRGEAVHFTKKEYDLLLSLLLVPGRIRTRCDLLGELWGQRSSDTKTLDTHIKRIRQKIEIDRYHPRHIITVRGVGYYFDLGGS